LKYEANNMKAETKTVKKSKPKLRAKSVSKKTVKKTTSLDARIYDSTGKEKGSINLPSNISETFCRINIVLA